MTKKVSNPEPTMTRPMLPPPPPSTKKTETKPNCIFPDCKHVSYSRGLCHRHYRIANTLVRKEQTTWDQLESHGKCLPSIRVSGTGEATWFLKTKKPGKQQG